MIGIGIVNLVKKEVSSGVKIAVPIILVMSGIFLRRQSPTTASVLLAHSWTWEDHLIAGVLIALPLAMIGFGIYSICGQIRRRTADEGVKLSGIYHFKP